MGKFLKTLAGIGAMAAVAGGVYYAYKNYVRDRELDEFEDEDFDDFDEELAKKDRNYVKIDIEGPEGEEAKAEAEAPKSEEHSDDQVDQF